MDLRTSSFPATGPLLVRIEIKIPRYMKIAITFAPSHIVFYRPVINFEILRIILFFRTERMFGIPISPFWGPWTSLIFGCGFFFLIYSSRHIQSRHPCQKISVPLYYLRRKWKKMGVCHKF